MNEQTPSTDSFMLQCVDEGRVFYRRLQDEKSCLLGVVRIPKGPWLGEGENAQPMECVMPACLNNKLWLGFERAEPLANHVHWQEAIPEMTPNNFLTGMQWQSWASSDFLQVGLREAPIADESGGKWAIVFAAINKRLDAMPQDGTYELGPQGLKLVDDRAFIGSAMNQVLREPLWGPQGQFGLSTGMRHDVYHAVIEKDRARNANRDPRFNEFMELMKEAGDLPLAYTAAQLAEREEISKRIIASIHARERINEMEGLAKALGIKPT